MSAAVCARCSQPLGPGPSRCPQCGTTAPALRLSGLDLSRLGCWGLVLFITLLGLVQPLLGLGTEQLVGILGVYVCARAFNTVLEVLIR